MDWNLLGKLCEFCVRQSPSLRGSGLKLISKSVEALAGERLPLYEGVDWNRVFWKSDWKRRESLPLYEGVDWNLQWLLRIIRHYRLPLYEGVDWNVNFMNQPRGTSLSPSLRGSGLKSPILEFIKQAESLPLYEGVDWNRLCAWCTAAFLCLPLYEGVDWNIYIREIVNGFYVSLFTREWIEISWASFVNFASDSLPLYEGVDWNWFQNLLKLLLENVSLFTREWIEIVYSENPIEKGEKVSLFTREWIEIFSNRFCLCKFVSPSLRGSGLKLFGSSSFLQDLLVSLFTREWIEIGYRKMLLVRGKESPSLRGSGLKWDSSRTEEEQEAVSLFTREWIEIKRLTKARLQTNVSLFTRGWIDWKIDI